jgi:hypothetical protein
VNTTPGLWVLDQDDLLLPVRHRHTGNGGKAVEFEKKLKIFIFNMIRGTSEIFSNHNLKPL